jgi:hypothetical protein
MGVAGWLWTFGAQNYLGKFLAKKAENLATHQDIQKLVDQVRETERVKAEIADRMWDRQRRWDAKKELYVEIYSSLPNLLKHLINVGEARKAVFAQGADANHSLVMEAVNQLQSHFDKFGDVGFIAPLFFSDAALARIADIQTQAATWVTFLTEDKLLARKGELDTLQADFSRHFNDAVIAFSAAARNDLGYPPASSTKS